MILWIILILAVALGIIAFVIYEYTFSDLPWASLAVLSGTFALTFILLGTVAIVNTAMADGERAALEEQYKALVYKAKTETIRDEFGLVNKSYVDEVQEWNTDIAKYKHYQRDFWIGIFYPNIYDELETIDLSLIKMREENNGKE